ncbi:uncharacterized protein LOC106159468 [Lingula anatina]|uniref:Uncharacterized protein LOC106159468 n=1 Tax=Lingula anatina TaxID=7574 RepID=A0A1S3HYW0_LINAN|nr:uncharacterized protein LOC106159468 [Lingula anatina]|eukprot:XP_013391210.1 uncharacterized protein LOC106159468 [Lingula anatina]
MLIVQTTCTNVVLGREGHGNVTGQSEDQPISEVLPNCDPLNQYFTVHKNGTIGCTTCSVCLPGSGVFWQCQGFNDTVCKKCEDGVSYSVVIDYTRVCDECNSCEDGQVLLRTCTKNHNVLCGRCKPGYDLDNVTGDCIRKEKIEQAMTKVWIRPTLSIPKHKGKEFSKSILLIAVTVVGGVLILLLIVALAVYVHRKRKCRMNRSSEDSTELIVWSQSTDDCEI